ncbi:UNVERIFIED_CONTAM: hypothetical protein K2H54_048778 [Gekko kuhli]
MKAAEAFLSRPTSKLFCINKEDAVQRKVTSAPKKKRIRAKSVGKVSRTNREDKLRKRTAWGAALRGREADKTSWVYSELQTR